MTMAIPNQMSLKTLDDPKPEEGRSYRDPCRHLRNDTKIYQGKFLQTIRWSWAMESSEKLLVAIPPKNSRLELGSWLTGPFYGKCFHCCRGDTQLCPNGGIMGREVNGGLLIIALPILRIPTNYLMRSMVKQAPPFRCLPQCHAQDNGGVGEGDTVTVTGLGVTGLMHIQLAKARGPNTLSVSPMPTNERWPWHWAQMLTHGADAKAVDNTGGVGADVGKLMRRCHAVLAEAMDCLAWW